MKKELILIVSLFLILTVYSQDYKVEKFKNTTKGDYKISRLLVITDSVPNAGRQYVLRQNAIGQIIRDTIHNAGINKFIVDFTSTLKIEFERHELDFVCIRKNTSDIKNNESVWDNLNPNGILALSPSNAFLQYRGLTQKNGVYFVLGVAYKPNNEDDYIQLFNTKIKVMIDSFENSGELAAQDFFNRMVKGKYLQLTK